MKKNLDDTFNFLNDLDRIVLEKKVKKGKKKSGEGKKDGGGKKDSKEEKGGKSAEKKKASEKKRSEKKGTDKKSADKAPIYRKDKRRKQKKESALLSFWDGLRESAAEMSTGDRIVISTGVLVLVMAVITGCIYVSAKNEDDQLAAFADLGEELGEVSLVGESGLIAVTDAEVAARNAQILEEEPEPEEEEENEEEETEAEDEVVLNLTSVQRDLKIKFMNRADGRLISGIAFQAEVKGPDGRTAAYEDDDKDGIIYKKELTPGEYEVALKETEELKAYKFSLKPVSVTVKDRIEYKKIEVADEIKTEAEVNVAAEDTAVQEAETSPALTDTVEWVESTKTPVGSDGSEGNEYEEVDKDDIPDPAQLASARSRFTAMTQEMTWETPDGQEKAQGEESRDEDEADGDEIDDEAEEKDSEKDGGSEEDKGTGTDPADSGKTPDGGASSGGSQEPKPEPPAARVTKVSISGAGDLTVGGSLTLTAKVEGENLSDGDKAVTWSSDSSAVTVDGSGKVTGAGEGSATITAVSVKNKDMKASCVIRVKNAPVTLTLDKSELTLKAGETANLTAKASKGGVSWKSDQTSVATVNDSGKVTAVSEGSALITAVSLEDGGVSASCRVTVAKSGSLLLKLDAESVKLYTEDTKELKASVSDASGAVSYSYAVDKKDIAAVEGSDTAVKVTGKAPGEALITVTARDASGQSASASCKAVVVLNPKKDTSTKLKDEDGNQLYIKNKKDEYVEAVLADYYTAERFYKKLENLEYRYTGWQTIDGRTYFYDKNGKAVTGEQIIQGAKYDFGSDGALITNSSSGIMGIDVSKWNGRIDWTAVKNAGVNYAIIRCGYRGSSTGALIQDPNFKSNIQGASAAGLKVGVYFFTQAVNEVEAVEEASMALELVKGHKLTYPIFLDVESSGGRADGLDKASRTAAVNAFCKTIQNGGYIAGVYANKTWFESKMNTASLSGYRLWLAQYAAAPTYKATRHDLWQYTSKGKINGISGYTDLNLSYLGY